MPCKPGLLGLFPAADKAPCCAGRRFDHEERKRKKEAREVHKRADVARKSIGLKGKMFAKKRYAEKAQMKKTIAMHEEKDSKRKADDGAPQNALPAYLLEREQVGLGSSSGGRVRRAAVAFMQPLHAPPQHSPMHAQNRC